MAWGATMSDAATPAPATDWQGATPSMVLAVLAIMAGFFFLDRFLVQLEQQELRHEAAGLKFEGDRLLARGEAAAAVTPYRRAHALFRADRKYALDYARALLASGDRPRAEATLREVLDRDSNGAPANLLMARTMLAAGKTTEAASYYHRAIYGAWPSEAAANRIRARLEFAAWLAQRNARDELLAELLPLQAALPAHPELGQRVADLLLAAGSPARAADAYRALLRMHPEDAAAYRGLGEAELRSGNYRAAQRILQEALRRNPSDIAIASRIQMVSTVNALDPTPRRLPSLEKYQRSLHLLELSANALRACAGTAATDLLAEADHAAAQKPKGAISNELSEVRLSLAQQLWRKRVEACHPESKPDEPLQIIMEKLLSP